MIEKIARPQGELLIPHKSQIRNWSESWENVGVAGFTCLAGDDVLHVLSNCSNPEDDSPLLYIRALLQPIPNFSTAMQFLEKGAVLTRIDGEIAYKLCKGGDYWQRQSIYLKSAIRRDVYTPWSHEPFDFWFIQELIYTPWIDRETGETDQAMKDFCEEILKG